MARGTTLAALLAMFKAEVRVDSSSSVAPGGDDMFKALLSTQQKWLVDEYDFPFMKTRADVPLVAGTRYYNIPATINLDARVKANIKLNGQWMMEGLPFGIDEHEFAGGFDSDAGVTGSIVLRWDLIATAPNTTQVEVWPIPNQAQTLRFVGSRPLNPLTDDAHTADIDDLILVFFTAAEYLTGVKGADAQAKLAKFQKRMTQIIGKLPKRNERFVMGGDANSQRRYYNRPTVEL